MAALSAAAITGCSGTGADEDQGEPIAGEAEALTRSGFSSYNIYKGVPATSVKCDLKPERFNLMVTAIRHDIFSTTPNICHKCVRVTHDGKSVTVRVIDESNDFTSNNGQRKLDMAPEAFRKIGSIAAGSIPVTFQFVSCPAALD